MTKNYGTVVPLLGALGAVLFTQLFLTQQLLTQHWLTQFGKRLVGTGNGLGNVFCRVSNRNEAGLIG